MTLFEKIIVREIPADFVYEDDQCVAIRDIHPQAPIHLLLIPKKVIVRISATEPADTAILGHLLITAGEIARREGFEGDGFRIVINNGRNAGEEVPHLHLHLLAGRPLSWPPG